MPQRPPGGKVNAANLNFRGLDALAAVLGTEVIAVSPVGDGPNVGVLLSQIGGGGQVDSVVSGANITVDATDPVNPIVNLDAAITGMTVNGVVLDAAGAATNFLNETGAYSIPPAAAVPDPLLLSDGTALAPTYSFLSDSDTGIFLAAAGILDIAVGGVARFIFSASSLRAENATGPIMQNEAATATNPVWSFVNDTDTGIGRNVDDAGTLVAGGVRVADFKEVAGNVQLLMPLQNLATLPSVGFGDGDSGFYEVIDDVIGVTLGGAIKFAFGVINFEGNAAQSGVLKNETATPTNPVLAIQGDRDTGIGWRSADRGVLVAGAVAVADFSEAAGVVQFTVPLQNNSSFPSIAFGDGDTGFHESADDTIIVSIAGIPRFQFDATAFESNTTGAGAIANVSASATIPSILADKGDLNTGLGHPGTDQMALVAGGLDCINIAETAAARQVGFYVTAPISLQTGVAVSSAGIHAALVALGLITA